MAGPVVVEATEFALAPSVEKTAAGEVTFTLDLEPGSYVIFSNTGGHYSAGMFIGFTVE